MTNMTVTPRPTTARISIATAQATAATELATLVRDRYMQAKMYRAQGHSGPGGRSVNTLLSRSRSLYEGLLSPAQMQLSEDVAGVKLNLVRRKAKILRAWMTDVTNAHIDGLLTISPTPLPALSRTARDTVRDEVYQALVDKLKEQGYAADDAALAMMPADVRGDVSKWLAAEVKNLKSKAVAREVALAADAAKSMERLIHDQLIEAGFRTEYSAWINDFVSMPYAVLKGPVVEPVRAAGWAGDKYGLQNKMRVGVRRVNPYNFVWAPDSRCPQSGAYVVECIPTRKDQLMQMARSQHWHTSEVLAALEYFQGGGPHDWLSQNPMSSTGSGMGWPLHGTIDRLQMHGLFSGRELERYNLGAGIEPYEFVEAVITVIGPFVVQARLQNVTLGGLRPYYTASFEPSADTLCGSGLPNELDDIQTAAYAAFWSMMRNAGYASGARGEVDFSRIAQHIPAGMTPEQVLAQPFHFVSPDVARTTGAGGAFKFHTIPMNVPMYRELLSFLEREADDESGIPAIAGGELQQATVGRAFRSVATLYGAATKRIKQVLTNVDQTVLSGLGAAMYHHNMLYALDDHPEFINLDASVKARGTAGLLEQELKNQAAVEALQAAPGLVQLAQLGGTALPAGLVNSIVANAAKGLGVDVSAYPELTADGAFTRAVDQAAINNLGPAAPPAA